MSYKIAILALVALQALYSSALPPCVCTRNLRPVCGSDGISYSNECLLNCEKYKTGTEITVEKNGPCHVAEPSCICTFDYKPVCGTDGITYPNRCSLLCKRSAYPSIDVISEGACPREPQCICTDELNEVCGSDGNTYANPCELNCATAKDSTLRVEHEGKCDNSVKIAEPVPPPCICTLEFDEVCGSDGNTYSNPCQLNCATAKDSTLRVQHVGKCDDSVKVAEPTVPACFCTYESNPVCGSNGVTYPNPCRLNCATAQDSTLRVQHAGKCDDSVKVAEPPVPACFCTYESNPVCGSNGVTYPNPCRLNCATAQDSTLRVQHAGKCDDSVKVAEPPVPACFCTYESNPVCGSNGVTYPNPCRLNCATAQDSTLRVQHAGKCDDSVKVAEPPVPACFCTYESNPVCGSNGVTYPNPCRLNCATAQDSTLRVQHAGKCGDVSVVNPIQGDKPRGCTCPRDLVPVCGSDGVTYNNECLLRCAGAQVSLARHAPC